jgi:glutamate-1-semialdehyde 2,1-aminomutase
MSTEASNRAFDEAQAYIPGGVNSPVRAFKSVGGTPLFIKEGQGGTMTDIDGNTYVDYVQSWGPLIFGHRDESIEAAVIEAVKHGLSFGAPTEAETELAHEVVSIFDSVDKIRFVSSGTEAVMILVQAGSGLATFGNPSSPGVPADFTKHTLLAKYNDLASVEKCFKDSNDIACIIIEPIAGNMGLVPADKEFLHALRKLCDDNGALLIFDEVMSGFRATLHGAESITGVTPDMITLGKVIGGGMPVGAFGGRKEVMAMLSPDGPVYQAGTLSGNPIAMAAGLAAVKKLKQNAKLYPILQERATRLVEGMKAAAANSGIDMVTDVRGSMFGFFFSKNPVKNFDDAAQADHALFAKFHAAMLAEGFYFACSGYETGFVCTATTDEMIENTIKAAEKIFAEVK